MFDKSRKLPTNRSEANDWFEELAAELSPENLYCDGEASESHVRASIKEINDTWEELEDLIGKKVSKTEFGD